jgi:8-oxo-dGTP pyrophosphatase MutT (NUDIX family)
MSTLMELKLLLETVYYGKKGSGVLAISKDTKKILLAYRGRKVNEPFTWAVIGGAIDPNESFDDAAKREFQEETGYKGQIDLIPSYVYKDGDFEYQNFIGLVPNEFIPEPSLNHSWETKQFKWFNLDEFLSLDPKHFGLKLLIKNSFSDITKYVY